jgi:CRP-like cAMP-binding protein
MDFIRQAQLLPVAAGTDVVRQGEVSRNFYLILEGKMRVHMHVESGRSIDLNTLIPGHFFGEFACVYRLPRTADVTAVDDAMLLEFSDASVAELMQRSPIAGERLMQAVRWRLIHAMTHSHPAFAGLPEADRQWLAEESFLAEFRDGEPVSAQGNLADHACVIVHGAIAAHGPDGDRHLATGAMFGDVVQDLQLAEGTALTADGRCLVCAIPRQVFQSFMNAYGGFEQWVQAHGEARRP